MALRLATRRAPKSSSLCRMTVASQRLYSTKHSKTYFSVEVGSETKVNMFALVTTRWQINLPVGALVLSKYRQEAISSV